MHSVALDEFDVRLLHALQQDSRLTHSELADRVFLSASQCQRRIKRLEELGVIAQYAVRLSRTHTGFGVLAIIHVSIEKHGKFPAQEFQQWAQNAPQVLECYTTMGDFDYFLKVVASDLTALNEFMMQQLLNSSIIRQIRSNILLQEVKLTHALPVQKSLG